MEQRPEVLMKARQLGARYACNAMLFGLFCAFWIIVGLTGSQGLADMIGDSPAQTLICVVMGPWLAHRCGAWAGPKVLLHGWNALLTSFCTGIISVAATTLAFSLVAFIEEGWPGEGSFTEAVLDYIGKPMFWVFVMGTFPILLASAGMAFAFRMARKRINAGSIMQ
ncbi:MAG: hypothetical protein JNM31_01020 [Flavobacteriales bacterium]|nr:hypothetical protein [Flavobacteriales bacterium]